MRILRRDRGSFPTDDAAPKLIYLAIRIFEKKGRVVREWPLGDCKQSVRYPIPRTVQQVTRFNHIGQTPNTDFLTSSIKRKVIPDSIVYSGCWQGYHTLDVSDYHHFRINHSKLFADRHNQSNGIENF